MVELVILGRHMREEVVLEENIVVRRVEVEHIILFRIAREVRNIIEEVVTMVFTIVVRLVKVREIILHRLLVLGLVRWQMDLFVHQTLPVVVGSAIWMLINVKMDVLEVQVMVMTVGVVLVILRLAVRVVMIAVHIALIIDANIQL
jgi:hypothetical protein